VQIIKIETSAAQSANCILLHAYLRRIMLQLFPAARTQKIHIAYGLLLLKYKNNPSLSRRINSQIFCSSREQEAVSAALLAKCILLQAYSRTNYCLTASSRLRENKHSKQKLHSLFNKLA